MEATHVQVALSVGGGIGSSEEGTDAEELMTVAALCTGMPNALTGPTVTPCAGGNSTPLCISNCE
jgi:hypothetical protein